MRVAARDLGGSFDQGGLFLAYQPKMNASDGRILGLETIVRWLKPNGATMDAADFFPLAGRYGPIGRWVMLTAFSQLKRWRDDGGAEWSLSINTSRDQLLASSFVESTIEAIRSRDLSPEDITLEVKEPMVARLGNVEMQNLQRLADHGVLVSLNDCSQGQSMLTLMQQLPLGEMKLASHAVKRMCIHDSHNAEIKGLINLAKGIGVQVVAKGVESLEQQAKLIEAGCDLIQGRVVAQPLLASQVSSFVAEFERTNGWHATGDTSTSVLH